MLSSPTMSLPQPPSIALLAIEPFRAAFEFAGHHLMSGAELPQGERHAVVIFPGLATNQYVTRPLQSFCEKLGYACFDWGMGVNVGPQGEIDAWLDLVTAKVQEQTAAHPEPISLVGWSLGGIYAREVAKRLEQRVRQVITLGSPFAGVAEQTRAGSVYRLVNGSHPPTDPLLLQALRTAPPVPTTSIYSQSDGIVAWQACLDPKGVAHAESIEIEGSHCGMTWNPAALRVVADRLAQPLGDWQPYAPAQFAETPPSPKPPRSVRGRGLRAVRAAADARL